MMHYAYKLFFAEEPNVIYVGQTNNLVKRFSSHRRNLKESPKKVRWVQDRQNRGWELKLEVLFSGDKDFINQKEIDLIKEHVEKGFILKNSSSCGESSALGFNHSEETKARISNAMKGIPKSEETKKTMSKSQSGKTISEKQKEMLRQYATGRIITQVTREKISKAHLGRTYTEETLSNMRIAQKDANAKIYTIITPDNEFIVISSLKKFCMENNLDRCSMSKIANNYTISRSSGAYKIHKGYKCFKGKSTTL